MAYYITRVDDMTQAVDTLAAVETGLDGGTAGAIRIPSGVSRITGLIVSLGKSIIDVADAGVTVSVRLTGPGLADGQQEITVGSLVNTTTSTGGGKAQHPVIVPVSIGVKPGNDLNIQASMNGVDPGTPRLAVTLELQ